MAGTIQCGRRVRHDFGKIPSIVEIPNLIEIQQQLVRAVPPEGRTRRSAARSMGLQAVFKSVFPIAGLQRQRLAGVRQLSLRRSEVHGGGVPRPRHDLRHPAQGDAAPRGVRPRQGGQDPRPSGSSAEQEVYLGELPAHDREGHLHHQRHRARGGQPAPALGRRVLRRRQGQDARLGQAALLGPRSSPTAARGWSSSSTPTTSSTCGSTAGARCSRRRSCAPSGSSRRARILSDEEILGQFYDLEEVLGFEDGDAVGEAASRRSTTGAKVADDVKPPRAQEAIVQAGKAPQREAQSRSWSRRASTKIPVGPRRWSGRRTGGRVVDAETGEVLVEANQEITSTDAGPDHGAGRWRPSSCSSMAPGKTDASIYETLARDHFKNPDEALVEIYRRLRPGDPPTVESARALFRGMFIDPRRYDLARVGRFMINKKLGIERRPQRQDAAQRGHRVRSSGTCCMVKLGQQADRRHRPPRQPARALGGRAAREPVPGRPHPHGAGGQGADVDLRHHQPDAARPHQRQAGLGGGEGVLRLLAALAVHGPDEPAGRADPQAPALRPRARAACRGSAPGSRCATSTRRTTGASARSRRRKARTSASSRRSRPTRASTSSGSSRRRTARSRRAAVTDEIDLPHRARGGAVRHRPGQRRDRHAAAGSSQERVVGPQERRVQDGAAGGAPLHGRVAQAAGVGGGRPDPVPRERRRQPGPHGLEHAAPGGAAAPAGGAAGRHRHGARGGPRLRARWSLAKRPGVVEYVSADRVVVRAESRVQEGGPGPGPAAGHLQPDQVPPLEPEHLHQPAADRAARASGWQAGDVIARRARAPTRASWRWAATCSSPSCRGAGTTSRTRSWSPSGSSRTTATPRSTSRSSRSRPATPSSARKRSRATSRTCPRRPSRTSTSRASCASGAKVKAGRHPGRQDHARRARPSSRPEEKLLRAIFGEKAGDVRDTSLTVPPGHRGHGGRRQGVLAARHRQGRARQVHRGRGDRPAWRRTTRTRSPMVEMERDQKLKNLLVGQDPDRATWSIRPTRSALGQEGRARSSARSSTTSPGTS